MVIDMRSCRRYRGCRGATPTSTSTCRRPWTKTAINNTEYNDQGAFDAANNRFVAPVAGTYLFVASLLYKSLLYKVNASTRPE